jgi:hypothetical protein
MWVNNLDNLYAGRTLEIIGTLLVNWFTFYISIIIIT